MADRNMCNPAFIPVTPSGTPAPSPGTTSHALSSKSSFHTVSSLVISSPSSVTSSTKSAPKLVRLSEPCPCRSKYPAAAPASGPSGTVVVWFRGDLRLHDHPAITHALEEAQHVIPVYCFDPRQFGKTPFGFEKTGRYRAKFLIEAIADLRETLQAMGSDLIVRRGHPEDILPALCRELGASSLFYHREVSYEEQQVEAAVDDALDKVHTEHKPFWANTLYHAEDLPFDIDDMPDVYTEFREAVQREGVIRAPLPVPDSLPKLPRKVETGQIPTLPQLGLSEPESAAHALHAFRGGEKEALSRLDSYINESRVVSDGRSTAVHLGADFSCKISPWLALGCVSPRKIHADLRDRAAKAGQTSTYFELIWRDFFRFITQKYAHCRIRKTGDASAGVGRVISSKLETSSLRSNALL